MVQLEQLAGGLKVNGLGGVLVVLNQLLQLANSQQTLVICLFFYNDTGWGS